MAVGIKLVLHDISSTVMFAVLNYLRMHFYTCSILTRKSLEVQKMKKAMIAAVCLIAGSAFAQSGVVMVDQGAIYNSSFTEATLEVALASAYVWRGQVLNNDTL